MRVMVVVGMEWLVVQSGTTTTATVVGDGNDIVRVRVLATTVATAAAAAVVAVNVMIVAATAAGTVATGFSVVRRCTTLAQPRRSEVDRVTHRSRDPGPAHWRRSPTKATTDTDTHTHTHARLTRTIESTLGRVTIEINRSGDDHSQPSRWTVDAAL
uniref:Secreted protein n=1 Tax=Anopheles darlingi TaxID=43151 RepID=A0A2M4D3U2_ANODA